MTTDDLLFAEKVLKYHSRNSIKSENLLQKCDFFNDFSKENWKFFFLSQLLIRFELICKSLSFDHRRRRRLWHYAMPYLNVQRHLSCIWYQKSFMLAYITRAFIAQRMPFNETHPIDSQSTERKQAWMNLFGVELSRVIRSERERKRKQTENVCRVEGNKNSEKTAQKQSSRVENQFKVRLIN